MNILDMRLLTGVEVLQAARANHPAVQEVMKRLTQASSELTSSFRALGETYAEGDYECYKFGLECMEPFFERLGALRCLYLVKCTSNAKLSKYWYRASYPCLIELFVQFLLYMDFERDRLDLVAEVESFRNYVDIVSLHKDFCL